MILLWGIESDSPMRMVRAALERRGAPSFFLDQRKLLATDVELRVAEAVSGRLVLDGEALDLATVSAAYIRPYDWTVSPELAGRAPDDPTWQRVARLHQILHAWTEVTPATVVNRPSAGSSNASKPHQLQLIRRAGFKTPETLVTTDPDEALRFYEQHREVIYKSVSGVRSIVSRLTPERLADLGDVAWCPTQFQRYLPGRDVRVHVIGERVMACEVITEAVDYRYPGEGQPRPTVKERVLPDELAARCVALAKQLGLVFAGVDLRDADGEWYCFEVNPSPGFSYYEANGGLPIADAVAELLERAG
jgi:hypothetical protein